MESHWANESCSALQPFGTITPQTLVSTLALRIETGDVDAIKVVGGEGEVREEEEGKKL
jgi:hypothetical protein